MKDLIGALISGLCIVQCLFGVVVVLLGGAGAAAATHHSSYTHLFFIIPVFVAAAISFPSAKKCHGSGKPIKMGGVGLFLLGVAIFFEMMWHLHTLEILLTIIGGSLLIYAHLQNRKLSQQVSADSCAP